MSKQVIWAALVTYLVISFVPALGLMSIMGKRPGGGKGPGA